MKHTKNSKRIIYPAIIIMMLALVACTRPQGAGTLGRAGDRPLATPALPDIGFSGTVEVPEGALRQVDPLLDFDPVSVLVTQAYEEVGIDPDANNEAISATATAIADPLADVPGTPGSSTASGGYVSPLLVTPTAHAPPPPLVAMPSSAKIPNVVNTAKCLISNVGDCQPAMQSGVDLHFTWTFGVEGDKQLQWWQAVIIVTRDGQGFRTIWVGNSADPSPAAPEDKAMSVINVGQVASFNGGIEDVEPGYYTAFLRMCLMEVPDCDDGRGWTDVGGETINFLIVQ